MHSITYNFIIKIKKKEWERRPLPIYWAFWGLMYNYYYVWNFCLKFEWNSIFFFNNKNNIFHSNFSQELLAGDKVSFEKWSKKKSIFLTSLSHISFCWVWEALVRVMRFLMKVFLYFFFLMFIIREKLVRCLRNRWFILILIFIKKKIIKINDKSQLNHFY